MIRKYIIFGKQVFLSSARREVQTEEETQEPIELRMPIDILWKCEVIIREAEFLQSMAEDPNKIKDTYKSLLKLVTPYAVFEKDRTWLLEQEY
ncbi:MAG: hypothetical protein NTV34_12925 [Proteobacteria bacterium]|nr:hypothetical protein [Pseudomonadota bacterium]